MHHIKNHHANSVHLWNRALNAHLTLKPGVNQLDESQLALHRKQIAQLGLQEVQALHDMPEAKKHDEAVEEHQLEAPKPKKSRKAAELKEDLEPLNE